MCGIAGLLRPDVGREELARSCGVLTDSMAHRGPDGRGVWVDESGVLALGHRRLAIQDISEAGAQPMLSESGRYAVSFNGEIYNFREIRRTLVGLGHAFKGHSDTEVMLATFEQWGVADSLRKFVGMYAFAVADQQAGELHLVRDRLGEKPLYFGWTKHGFAFASELKAFKRLPDAVLRTDRRVLAGYFEAGYVPAPYSIYEGIYKLLPGTILSLSLDDDCEPSGFDPCTSAAARSPRAYWTCADAAAQGRRDPVLDIGSAADLVDAQLHETIRDQLVADVPLGAFLSGGIDSSLVCAVAQKHSSTPLRTFTIGYEDPNYDESEFAAAVARHIGTRHTTLTATAADALELATGTAEVFDEPFADSSSIPTLLVSRMAREHVTVCLSGDAGDELFGGYNRYLSADRLHSRTWWLPTSVRRAIGKVLQAVPPGAYDKAYESLARLLARKSTAQKLVGRKAHKLGNTLQFSDIDTAYANLLSYWPSAGDLFVEPPERLLFPDMFDPAGMSSFLDRAMFVDQVGYLPGDNLCKVDRSSMAVSLETRLPLLDHRMVEASWRIPAALKMHGNRTKAVLREVLYRYVPPRLIERPKMGFSVPIDQWLRRELRPWAEGLLDTVRSGKVEFLRSSEIQRSWEGHQSGRADHANRLWCLLMFLSWNEHTQSTRAE